MALLFELKQKLSQGFFALWARYPNKSAKKDAEKAYGQVVTTPEIDQEVHQALDWMIPYWQTLDWYSPPYLATFLRKERFRDPKPDPKPTTTRNPATVKPLPSAHKSQQEAIAQIQRLIHHGMKPEAAKRKVYIEMGWIREDQP